MDKEYWQEFGGLKFPGNHWLTLLSPNHKPDLESEVYWPGYVSFLPKYTMGIIDVVAL